MTILISMVVLAFAWLAVCLVGHGYANTADHLAWLIHRHAKQVRARHRARAAVVSERWVRELEA
jgi:hypothetical protein